MPPPVSGNSEKIYWLLSLCLLFLVVCFFVWPMFVIWSMYFPDGLAAVTKFWLAMMPWLAVILVNLLGFGAPSAIRWRNKRRRYATISTEINSPRG